MRFIGVLNRDGGTFKTLDMTAFCERATTVFAAHGHELECRVVAGRELLAELERAATDPICEALLAGGGDGTISAAAEIAFRRTMPLAVVPAGTMNLFARAVGVPLDLEQALQALAAGHIEAVDIATANGQPFVHQFGVGIHARLVRIRDGMIYSSRIGKMLASVRAVVAAVVKPLRFHVDIETPGGSERVRCSGLAVSNNPLAEGHVPYADGLDQGVLGLYVVKPMSPWALGMLLVAVILGRWKGFAEISDRETRRVNLSFPRNKASTQAVIDGELINLEDEVDIHIHPGALKIVAPKLTA